jgi:hypothetical protein
MNGHLPPGRTGLQGYRSQETANRQDAKSAKRAAVLSLLIRFVEPEPSAVTDVQDADRIRLAVIVSVNEREENSVAAIKELAHFDDKSIVFRGQRAPRRKLGQ